MSSSEVRNMTAADFQRHIDEEGAQQFVRRLIKDIDPHSPEEPNYDIVLEHVAEGSNGWLHAAAQIAPYTDATFSQGIRVAIADALVVNPTGVLKMIGTEEHFDEACGYPFVRQTETYMLQHKREALAALNRVHQPALATEERKLPQAIDGCAHHDGQRRCAAPPRKHATRLSPLTPPVQRDRTIQGMAVLPPVSPLSRACFSAKYHFAGLSASSISISVGLCCSPCACSIIVC